MINNIIKSAEIRMQKCISLYIENINKICIGRARPDMLNGIKVKCYGTVMELKQLVNITVEDNHTLLLTVFDQNISHLINKAIMMSDLGLNPNLMNKIIRIHIPSVTEERRKKFVKIVKSEAEHWRISIRNIRRDINNKLKQLLKDKEISDDEEKKLQCEIQKITDIFIKKIENVLNKKENELMQI